jgi:hypothetical protein
VQAPAQPAAPQQPQQPEQQPQQPSPPQQPAEQPAAEKVVEKPAEELPPEAKTPEGRSQWNLKKLAEAMKAYHEKNGRFPAAATYKEEKPLLSWRVQLLPFLGAEALYKEFHLDEPWDSDHNRTLLSRIPEIFQTPGGPGEGKTCYLVAAGLGTMFGQREGISKNLIADGPDKTIMIVEADVERAAPWTQPQDLQYIPASPGAGLGAMRGKAFLAVFADGVVHKISTEIGADPLRGLFTYNGREILDLAAIEGKPGEGGAPARKPSEGMVAEAEQFFAQGDHVAFRPLDSGRAGGRGAGRGGRGLWRSESAAAGGDRVLDAGRGPADAQQASGAGERGDVWQVAPPGARPVGGGRGPSGFERRAGGRAAEDGVRRGECGRQAWGAGGGGGRPDRYRRRSSWTGRRGSGSGRGNREPGIG